MHAPVCELQSTRSVVSRSFRQDIEGQLWLLQIDPGNEQLLQQHLACAAAEMPLHLHHDRVFFGHRLPEIASFLQSVGKPST